jgi:hypothetical protein
MGFHVAENVRRKLIFSIMTRPTTPGHDTYSQAIPVPCGAKAI